jgi:predicted nucleic acid-binding protein
MLLDTSILVELLQRPADDPVVERILDALGDEPMLASAIHLGEVADAARRKGLAVEDAVSRAQVIAEFVPVDQAIAIEASRIKAEARKRAHGKDFSLSDGVGLATARSRGLRFITLDPEFAGFPDALVMKR